MSLLGNIIWLICGGLFSGLGHIFGGIVLCLTIIGIPFGYQEIKIGIATFAPFGTELVEYENANSPLNLVLNVIWLLTFGWLIALHHLIWAAILAITIIGIPFALQHLKLVPLALLPFGRDLVRGPFYQNAWADRRYESTAARMR
ncbi:MAG TPA: YccF domain-containing protein [Planctomycetaceae bacterium]|nr:YccF domain-containing protein [Planctomycetaceae bacterium]